MEREYPENEKWLPKLFNFKTFKSPKKRCGICEHSYCHNPGAYITGLSCRKIEAYLNRKTTKLKEKDEKGNELCYTSAVNRDDVCDKYN